MYKYLEITKIFLLSLILDRVISHENNCVDTRVKLCDNVERELINKKLEYNTSYQQCGSKGCKFKINEDGRNYLRLSCEAVPDYPDIPSKLS